MKRVWPLPGCAPLFPDAPGRFGYARRNDIHTGIDLYCELGQPVTAIEDGVVVKVKPFTGSRAARRSTWWNDTDAVLVEGASGVITYGEIATLVEKGDKVIQGQQIAAINQAVLRRYKGRPMVMLHLMLLPPGSRYTPWWYHGEPQPTGLLSPEPFLMEIAGDQLEYFDLSLYGGVLFRALNTYQENL